MLLQTSIFQNLKDRQKDFEDENIREKILNRYLKTRHFYLIKKRRQIKFKLIHKAFVSFLFNKQVPSAATCSWCKSFRPSLLHRFWECPEISAFCAWTLNYIFGITSTQIAKNQILCLFGHGDILEYANPSHKPKFSTWTWLCLLTAHKPILKSWVVPTPPSLSIVKKDLKILLYNWKIGHIKPLFQLNKPLF